MAVPALAAADPDGAVADALPMLVATNEARVEVQGAAEQSSATLAGAAGVFLALGLGTTVIAHRRRWRVVDLRDAAPTTSQDSADPTVTHA